MMILKFIIIINWIGSDCQSFLINDRCRTDLRPCTRDYSGTDLKCSNRSLLEIPKIIANVSSIHLDYNNLTELNNDSFECLLPSLKIVSLHLENNHLYHIAEDTFKDIGHAILELYLTSNKLTRLSAEFRYLSALNTLDVLDNPIQYIDISATVIPGHTLKRLLISLSEVTAWPVAFKYLRVLFHLHVEDLRLKTLPDNAFHGFEHSLVYFRCINSHLQTIPTAICNLKNPNDIVFYTNSGLNESLAPVKQPCIHVHNKTTSQHFLISESTIETFPNVQYLNSQIETLILSHNKLHIMNSDMIHEDYSLRILDLGQNYFVRIPFAVNRFNALQILDLSHNLIQSVEFSDISELRNLHQIYLSYNPIEFIARGAFKTTTKLAYVDLSGTNLKRIPSALTEVYGLSHLDLSGLSIDCTCDMAYLKNWTIGGVTFSDGSLCFASNERIKQYMINILPTCT